MWFIGFAGWGGQWLRFFRRSLFRRVLGFDKEVCCKDSGANKTELTHRPMESGSGVTAAWFFWLTAFHRAGFWGESTVHFP